MIDKNDNAVKDANNFNVFFAVGTFSSHSLWAKAGWQQAGRNRGQSKV